MTNPVIIELAEALANDLLADVALASTRMEHVRVSSRANAARTLLLALKENASDGSEAADETHLPLF
jgi:hypothetical protein